MSHLEHLLCRNGWYYFRIRIPADLTVYFPRNEVRKSLKTKDIYLARILKKMYLADIGKIFTLIRTGMLNRDHIQEVVRKSCLTQLAFHEERRDAGDHAYAGSLRVPAIEDDIRKTKSSLAELDFHSHSNQVKTIIAEHNLDIIETSDEYRILYREFLKQHSDMLHIEMERCKGNYNNEFDRNNRPALTKLTSVPLQIQETSPSKSKTLSEVIKIFMASKDAKEPNTLKNYRGMNNLVLKVLGDKPIDKYEYEELLGKKKILEKIPKNATSTEGWKELSIDEIINLKNAKECYSSTNVMKYLIHINSLFKFAAERDWINKSPCPTWEKSKKEKKEIKKVPYSNEDLESLYKSPHYSIVSRRYKTPQNFWVPLFGNWGGLRVDEACQLYKADVSQIEGIWCISIDEEEDKKVKTPASIRIIPIHPTILELGFLDYVDCVKTERLFPGLKNNPNEGQGYSHDFDKNINKYLKRHVSEDKRKTYHSTRKSFAKNLKQHGLHNDLIGAILGHGAKNEVTEGYTGEYPVGIMLEAMKKIDYGFDAKALIGTWDPKKCGGKITTSEKRRKSSRK